MHQWHRDEHKSQPIWSRFVLAATYLLLARCTESQCTQDALVCQFVPGTAMQETIDISALWLQPCDRVAPQIASLLAAIATLDAFKKSAPTIASALCFGQSLMIRDERDHTALVANDQATFVGMVITSTSYL